MKPPCLAVIIAFVISLKGIPSSSNDCDYHYGKYCYVHYSDSVNASTAKARCRLKGGNLAVVYNSDVAAVLTPMIRRYFFSIAYPWVASVRRTDKGEIFPDGTFLDRSLIIKDEDSSQDKSLNNDLERICLSLSRNKLKILNCATETHFICQFKGKNCYLDDEELASLSNDETCMQAFAVDHFLKPTEQVPVACKSGFVPENESNVTCLANGSLTGMQRCIPGCYPPEISKNARIINVQKIYRVFNTILVVCDKGFFGVGDNVKTHLIDICFPGGQWTIKDYNCTDIQPFRPVHNILDEVAMMVAEGSTISLSCPTERPGNVWINQNEVSLENSKYEIQTNGHLILKDFSFKDVGLYTCINNNNEFTVHNLQLKRLCPDYDDNYYEAHSLEGSRLFLACNGSNNASEIKWFKNNERFWGNEKVKILRNGMIIFVDIHWSDTGEYVCMVLDLVNKCNLNTTIKIHVKAKDKCGLIAGDTPLEDMSQLPWLAVLWWPRDLIPFCYGTLISDRWIITTASCLFGSHRNKKPGFIVKFGKAVEDLENLENVTTEYVTMSSSAVVIHPDYSRRLNHNDVGLIRLENPILLNNHYSPLCLPFDPLLTDQYSCQHWTIRNGYMSGFGPLDSNWEYRTIVERMQIVSQSNCQVAFPLPSNMFCANSFESSEFAGDSGAPLQIKWKNRWYLWGVLSVSDRASGSGKYDYFSKITQFLPWIQSIINNS